ncbi:MAG: SPASM domain-containing protein [Lachnospiraceae bacterium]|nr:SPASM domain-containing protein [Lachnospiraceae bacterium]
MYILRNQTISVFDIAKRKTHIDFLSWGSDRAELPCHVQASFEILTKEKNRGRPIKPSAYNYFREGCGCAFLWNTASDACVILNSREASHFTKPESSRLSDDFHALLYELGFYVDADLDEVFRIDLLRKRHAYAYPENGHIDIEILPTQSCNARCFYCFEQKFTSLTMNEDIANEVIRYICSHVTADQNVCFIWFGGEPLLGEKIIDRILSEVRDFYGGKLQYTSSITTNNSLLTDEILQKFDGLWRVTDVLTTIDGYREEHNSRKAYVDKSVDAYAATLANLKRLVERGIKTTCRLNLDKENICQLDSILSDLQPFSACPNFSIQLTTLRNKTDSRSVRDKYFAADEYPSFYQTVIPRLFAQGFVRDPLLMLPVRDSSNCISCALNKVVINANGNLFRCVQDSLADENAVGNCRDGMRSNWNYTKWYQEIDNLGESCESCIYLPCCQGGCKQYRRSPSFDTTPCFRKKFYIGIIADEVMKKYEKEC